MWVPVRSVGAAPSPHRNNRASSSVVSGASFRSSKNSQDRAASHQHHYNTATHHSGADINISRAMSVADYGYGYHADSYRNEQRDVSRPVSRSPPRGASQSTNRSGFERYQPHHHQPPVAMRYYDTTSNPRVSSSGLAPTAAVGAPPFPPVVRASSVTDTSTYQTVNPVGDVDMFLDYGLEEQDKERGGRSVSLLGGPSATPTTSPRDGAQLERRRGEDKQRQTTGTPGIIAAPTPSAVPRLDPMLEGFDVAFSVDLESASIWETSPLMLGCSMPLPTDLSPSALFHRAEGADHNDGHPPSAVGKTTTKPESTEEHSNKKKGSNKQDPTAASDAKHHQSPYTSCVWSEEELNGFVIKHGDDVVLAVPWNRLVLVSRVVDRTTREVEEEHQWIGDDRGDDSASNNEVWPLRRLPIVIEEGGDSAAGHDSSIVGGSAELPGGRKGIKAFGEYLAHKIDQNRRRRAPETFVLAPPTGRHSFHHNQRRIAHLRGVNPLAEHLVVGFLFRDEKEPQYLEIRHPRTVVGIEVAIVHALQQRFVDDDSLSSAPDRQPNSSGAAATESGEGEGRKEQLAVRPSFAIIHQAMADVAYDKAVLRIEQESGILTQTGGINSKTGRRTGEAAGLVGAVCGICRKLVSKKKRRYEQDGYSLDLAYITPNILAMGFPCVNKEAKFRNPMCEVVRFLEHKHSDRASLLQKAGGDDDGTKKKKKENKKTEDTMMSSGAPNPYEEPMHTPASTQRKQQALRPTPRTRQYLVVNLCAERSYPPLCFGSRFERYPFDDHEAPPLQLLQLFCRDATAFLLGPSFSGEFSFPRDRLKAALHTPEAQRRVFGERTLAIHCKAGKGRTGVSIVALLMHLGICRTLDEALTQYGEKRSKNAAGITVPSQFRFMRYYARMVEELDGGLPRIRPVSLQSLTLSSAPMTDMLGGCTPYVMVQVRQDAHLHRALGRSSLKMTPDGELVTVFDGRTGALSGMRRDEHEDDQQGDTLEHEKEGVLFAHHSHHHHGPTDPHAPVDFHRYTMGSLQHSRGRIVLSLGGITVEDEVKISVWSKKTSGFLQTKDDLLFSCWIHASFLNEHTGSWSCTKWDLDHASKTKSELFDPQFKVTLHFTAHNPMERPTPSRRKKEENFRYLFDLLAPKPVVVLPVGQTQEALPAPSPATHEEQPPSPSADRVGREEGPTGRRTKPVQQQQADASGGATHQQQPTVPASTTGRPTEEERAHQASGSSGALPTAAALGDTAGRSLMRSANGSVQKEGNASSPDSSGSPLRSSSSSRRFLMSRGGSAGANELLAGLPPSPTPAPNADIVPSSTTTAGAPGEAQGQRRVVEQTGGGLVAPAAPTATALPLSTVPVPIAEAPAAVIPSRSPWLLPAEEDEEDEEEESEPVRIHPDPHEGSTTLSGVPVQRDHSSSLATVPSRNDSSARQAVAEAPPLAPSSSSSSAPIPSPSAAARAGGGGREGEGEGEAEPVVHMDQTFGSFVSSVHFPSSANMMRTGADQQTGTTTGTPAANGQAGVDTHSSSEGRDEYESADRHHGADGEGEGGDDMGHR